MLMASSAPTSPPDGHDPAAFVRPELAARPEYRLDLSPCRFKLDQNESPYELPRAIKRRVADELAAAPWAPYPTFHADRLRAALSAAHDWPAAGILVGNGSNELLAMTLAATTRAGAVVVGADPTFGLYRTMIVAAGGEPSFLPPREDLRLPVEALLDEAEEHPNRAQILCSPNNPTGDAIPPDGVAALARRLRAPLFLDNAYGEFCRHDYRPLLGEHRNLVLFRTFSKAWALGGLRVGYLLADPSLVAELLKVKLPYNLSRGSEAAALAALEAGDRVARHVELVVRRRAQWAEMLAGHGLEVFPSEANFLLARVPGGAEAGRALFAALAARSIRVRDVGGYPGLAGCLRVSVGDGAALRAVDQALAEIGEDGHA
jgi:histidinol-phosphate aminotransferase